MLAPAGNKEINYTPPKVEHAMVDTVDTNSSKTNKLKQLTLLQGMVDQLLVLKELKAMKQRKVEIPSMNSPPTVTTACTDTMETQPMFAPEGDVSEKPEKASFAAAAVKSDAKSLEEELETEMDRVVAESHEADHGPTGETSKAKAAKSSDESHKADDTEKSANDEVIGPENQAKAHVTNEDGNGSCRRQLIIPKNWNVPIVQTATNIFDPKVCKQIKWKSEADGPKDVEAPSWATQQDLSRKPKRNAKAANVSEDKEAKEEMSKPKSWGQSLEPDVQKPPKKRGRKPKNEVNEEQEMKEEKASKRAAKSPKDEPRKKKQKQDLDEHLTSAPPTKKTNAKHEMPENAESSRPKKRSRAKKAEKPEEKAEGEEPAESTASQRTGAYLKRQKEKKIANTEQKAEPEKITEEDDKEKCKGPEKGKKPGEAKTKKPGEAKTKKPGEAKESEEAKKSIKSKKSGEPADPAKEEKLRERKAKQSRKSSAYHVAYKACTGTEEEKRAAAKKAPCIHYMCIPFNLYKLAIASKYYNIAHVHIVYTRSVSMCPVFAQAYAETK